MTDGPGAPADDADATEPQSARESVEAPTESPVFAMTLDEPAGEAGVDKPAESTAETTQPLEPVATEGTPEPEPAVEPGPTADPQPEPLTDALVVPAVVPAAAQTAQEAATPATPASHRAKRRRRWPWVTLVSILVALALVGSAGLWYVSALIGAGMAVPQPTDPFPMSVLGIDGKTISYSGSPGGWVDAGLQGIGTIEGGYIQTKSPHVVGQGDTATTTRDISAQVLPPTPAAGQAAALDGWYYPRNPKVGLGVDYQDVLYPSPSGPAPAWFIPGSSKTWVIFTHGRGALPREGLRIASTVTKLGYPMLLINYRDDPNAPAEDGLGNFGANEWPDLEAAVKYALDHGAAKVVLAGASMGASVSLSFLQNSPQASSVVGCFFDAPAINFGAMVEASAKDMGLPAFVTAGAMQVASWRYGIDWAATDHSEMAASLTTPTLIVQGTEDTKVPAATVEAFAAAANPTTVKLELFEGAGHVLSWNVDRARYDSLLSAFLTKVAPA